MNTERRVAGDAKPYVSNAEPRPIVLVAKPLFWSVTLGLIAIITLTSRNSAALSAYHR